MNVLECPLDFYEKCYGAPSKEDCEVVLTKLDSSWKADKICDVMLDLFNRFGAPSVILKDEGADLKARIKLALKKQKELSRHLKKKRVIVVVADIGHKTANILKSMYVEHLEFKGLMQTLHKIRANFNGNYTPVTSN